MKEFKKAIEEQLENWEIKPDDAEYSSAIVMLAALNTGANADKVAKLSGLPRNKCREIGKILRKNKIWVGGKTSCEWFEKDGGIAFMCDLGVAMGWLARSG